MAKKVRNDYTVDGLSDAAQKALQAYKVKGDRPGMAPAWKPIEGDYIIGKIISSRKAGQYGTWIATFHVTESSNAERARAGSYVGIWITADLEIKMNPEEDGLDGRSFFIQCEGEEVIEEAASNPELTEDKTLKRYIVKEIE